jgi:uncharacterized protein YecT (DUF1311 family)
MAYPLSGIDEGALDMKANRQDRSRRISGALGAVLLVLASFLAPSGVAADSRIGPLVDTSIIDTCLEEATRETRTECVGLATKACKRGGKTGGKTGSLVIYVAQGSHVECQSSEVGHWDRLVTDTYVTLFRKETRRNKLRWMFTDSRIAPQIAFAEMHQAWQKLRKATCHYEWARDEARPLARGEPSECRLQMTARYYFELQDRMAGAFSWN